MQFYNNNVQSHKCNRICQKLGMPRPELPQNLTAAGGVWSQQRFENALRAGMERAGIILDNVPKDPQEEAAEKVYVCVCVRVGVHVYVFVCVRARVCARGRGCVLLGFVSVDREMLVYVCETHTVFHSVLQCLAVSCSVLQFVAVSCRALQCVVYAGLIIHMV